MTQDVDSLPPQVLKGMDMSHEAYRFGVFNCDEPEDVLTQNIPHGCSLKALDGEPQDTDSVPKHEYTILQQVATFEYPATLCTLRRSCDYYDCVWRLHVRIATPAMVYQQETMPIHEFAIMDLTRIFRDPLS